MPAKVYSDKDADLNVLQGKTLAVLGFGGGLLHVVNHAVFKGLLFLGAGAVLHSARTRTIEELGGLLGRMPWTGIAFLTGAVAVAGLPPGHPARVTIRGWYSHGFLMSVIYRSRSPARRSASPRCVAAQYGASQRRVNPTKSSASSA